MKKFLSIFFVSIIVLSIMASVSDSIQQKVKAFTGDKMYSTAVVPLPDQLTNHNNLAAKTKAE
jgi:hypothetical protein